MSTVGLLWGLCNDQLCLCCPTSVVGSSPSEFASDWNPSVCKANSGACSLPASVTQLSSGWTWSVLTTQEGQAYVLDTADLKQPCQGQAPRQPQSSEGQVSPHLQQQSQDQQRGQLVDSNKAWQVVHLHLPPPAPSRDPHQAAILVTRVAAGDLHCLLLDQQGRVWAFGSNKNGQLGTADQQQAQGLHGTSSDPKQQAQQLEGVEPGAAAHLQTAGQQHISQTAATALQPVVVLGPESSSDCQEPVSEIAAGACHSLAITSTTGRLYTWGWSAQGQCGTGSTSDVLQPTLCKALDGVPLADVAAGMAHSVVASRDGAVYTFGWNNNGQLGLGRTTVEPGQQQQQQLFSSLEPKLVEDPLLDDEHITKVACGSRHTVVLSSSSRVFTWGFNKYGQCCTIPMQHATAAAEPLAASRLQAPQQWAAPGDVGISLQDQKDVCAPCMVALPDLVSVGPSLGFTRRMQSVAEASSGPDHCSLACIEATASEASSGFTTMVLGKAVGVQAGGWHTLVEMELQH